jgi:hypothetical protein
MTNPNGPLPSFDQLQDEAQQRYAEAEQRRLEQIGDHHQAQADQTQAHQQASQDLMAISHQLSGFIDAASERIMSYDPDMRGVLLRDHVPTLDPKSPLTRVPSELKGIPFYLLSSDAKYGAAAERVILAPGIGRLVTQHTYVPSALQAQNVGMSPDARKHREKGVAFHKEPVDMLLDAGRIFGPPSERAHKIGLALADLVVTLENGRLPQVPTPQKPEPNPHIAKKGKLEKIFPHQIRHWTSR